MDCKFFIRQHFLYIYSLINDDDVNRDVISHRKLYNNLSPKELKLKHIVICNLKSIYQSILWFLSWLRQCQTRVDPRSPTYAKTHACIFVFHHFKKTKHVLCLIVQHKLDQSRLIL